jgi:hypothetical protein
LDRADFVECHKEKRLEKNTKYNRAIIISRYDQKKSNLMRQCEAGVFQGNKDRDGLDMFDGKDCGIQFSTVRSRK